MKKLVLNYILLKIILLLFTPAILAQPNLSAQAAILLDAKTGEILYKKDIHQQRAPASTTKVMTGILAIELGDLDDQVVVSARAANEGGSSVYLEEGETLSLEELIYALLVKSGNDSAIAIAEHIGGSVENFATLMNQKAVEIGAKNTNFLNPNGLPQQGHYTTAYDLAQITRYALNNEFFAKVVNTETKRIDWPGRSWDRILNNTNRLLSYSPDVDGVKTGYTRKAGRCLVASATREGQQKISVLLKSGNMWQESLDLLDYGFNNYSVESLVEEGSLLHYYNLDGKYELGLKVASDFDYIVPKGKKLRIKREIELRDNLRLPIKEDEKIGHLSFYKDEKLLGRVDLISDRKIDKPAFLKFVNKIISTIQIYF